MTMVMKPPLEEVYLEHFGVKGMKWGVRKKGNESRDKPRLSPTARKVVIGTAVGLGAAATAYVLAKHGSSSASKIKFERFDPKKSTHSSALSELRNRQAHNFNVGKSTRGKTLFFDSASNRWAPDVSTTPASRVGMRELMSAPKRKVDLGDLDSIRAAMNDPNHVWEL